MWESNTKVTVKERDHEQALKGSCESLLPGKRRTRASLAPTADTLAGCQSGTRSYPQSHPRPLRDMQVTHEVTLTNFPCVLQSHCKSGSPRATCLSTLEGRRPKVGAPDTDTVSHAPVCPQCLGHHGDPEKRHRPRPWSRRDQDDTRADWGEGSCA